MTSTISRRGFLAATAGASALGLSGIRPAQAAFPERGITVVVPYAAGGGSWATRRIEVVSSSSWKWGRRKATAL